MMVNDMMHVENIDFMMIDTKSEEHGKIFEFMRRYIIGEKRTSELVMMDMYKRMNTASSEFCNCKGVFALADGNPVGMAVCSYYGISKVVDLQFVYIIPKYRRLGIGKKMANHLVDLICSEVHEPYTVKAVFARAFAKDEAEVAEKFGYGFYSIYTNSGAGVDGKEAANMPFFIRNMSEDKPITTSLIRGFCHDIILFDHKTNPDTKKVVFAAINKSFEQVEVCDGDIVDDAVYFEEQRDIGILTPKNSSDAESTEE